MENTRIADNVSEVIDSSRKYIRASLKLLKLSFLERLSQVVSLIISTTLVIMAGALCLLFLSLSAAKYVGEILQSQAMGYLIMALFFFFLAIILWIKRKTVVINRVIRNLHEIVFKDDDRDEE